LGFLLQNQPKTIKTAVLLRNPAILGGQMLCGSRFSTVPFKLSRAFIFSLHIDFKPYILYSKANTRVVATVNFPTYGKRYG
jgi:hypothetical protein